MGKMIFCIIIVIFFSVNTSAQISGNQMIQSFNQGQREQKQWLHRQLPSQYYFNGKYTYQLPRYAPGATVSYTRQLNGGLLLWQPGSALAQPYSASPSLPFLKKKELSPVLKKVLFEASLN
ncbi:MAG: hypothetical protein ACO1OO_07070 [Flavisolibacter sp.]